MTHVSDELHIQLNAEGLPIILTITDDETTLAVDISTATIRKVLLRKPSGDFIVADPADFVTNGADGKLKYVTVAGNVDEVGVWLAQAYVQLATLKSYTTIAYFMVDANIE